MSNWEGNEENRHVLTREDAVKGGRAISERKNLANAVRALKHGKQAKALAAAGFEFCSGCPYKDCCMLYRPNQACQLKFELLKQVNKVAGPGGSQAWLNVLLRNMQELLILSKGAEDKRLAMQQYVKLWLEFGKIMFPKQIQVSSQDREIKVVFGVDEDAGDSADQV